MNDHNDSGKRTEPGPDGAILQAWSEMEAGELDRRDFDRYLKSAAALIEKSKLGEFGAFMTPFSSQFKKQVRDNFPDDQDAYDEADSNETFAIRKALHMRLWTLLVYFVNLVFLFIFLGANFGLQFLLRDASAIVQGGAGLVAFIFISACLYWLRWKIRDDHLSTIGGRATKFSNHFFKKLNNVHDRAGSAVRLSSEDGMLGKTWPERSEGWIRISLWFSKRYEYLDRYVTAVAWRVEDRYRLIEYSFRAAKVALLAIAFAAAVAMYLEGAVMHAWFAGPALAAFGLFASTKWIFTGEGNAYWAERFRESLTGFDKQKHHIFDLVARASASDKRWVMSGQRNVRPETDE